MLQGPLNAHMVPCYTVTCTKTIVSHKWQPTTPYTVHAGVEHDSCTKHSARKVEASYDMKKGFICLMLKKHDVLFTASYRKHSDQDSCTVATMAAYITFLQMYWQLKKALFSR